jgi:hypothetical protein
MEVVSVKQGHDKKNYKNEAKNELRGVRETITIINKSLA